MDKSTNTLTIAQILRAYFTLPDGTKPSVKELKALSQAERAELALLAATEMGVTIAGS